MKDASFRCERADVAHAEALLALFDSAGSGCCCNYWYFEGDKNAWLERCYIKPEDNRAALVSSAGEGPDLCGVVAHARDSETLCGWMNISRATRVPRLYDQRVYRNLPCFQAGSETREDVYAVACCYVAEAERWAGVQGAPCSKAPSPSRARQAAARSKPFRGPLPLANGCVPTESGRGRSSCSSKPASRPSPTSVRIRCCG